MDTVTVIQDTENICAYRRIIYFVNYRRCGLVLKSKRDFPLAFMHVSILD